MTPAIEKTCDEARHLPFGGPIAAWDRDEQSRVNEIMSSEAKLMSRDDLNRRLNVVRTKHSA